MAIKGSLKEASLPDVIQLLALGRKTGCLAIADRQNFGSIYFDEGRIMLRRDRQPARPDRRPAAQEPAHHQRAAGRGDPDPGCAPRAAAGRHPGRDGCGRRGTNWSGCSSSRSRRRSTTCSPGPRERSTSRPGCVPSPRTTPSPINPESLLLEGARRVDELSQIEKKIPSFDLIFAVDPGHTPTAEVSLSPEEAADSPAARRLARRAAGDRRDLADRVRGGAGALRPDHRRLSSAGSAPPPRPMCRGPTIPGSQEHRNLGIAFFKTGMLDEAQREFRRVADLMPADAGAAFFLGLIALKQARWLEAVDVLQQAATQSGAGRCAAQPGLCL